MKTKIFKERDLKDVMQEARSQGVTFAATSGCFDILHAGHVEYLEAAKKKGDRLIVLLNSDQSVKQLKGEKRPIVSESDRAIVIAGLEAVDYVCVFDERTPCRILKNLQPDIFVKGGDYQDTWIPEMEAVAEYGGCVEYVLLVENHSTTDIIKKIEEQCEVKGI